MSLILLGTYALICFTIGMELSRAGGLWVLGTFSLVGLIALQLGFFAGSFLSE